MRTIITGPSDDGRIDRRILNLMRGYAAVLCLVFCLHPGFAAEPNARIIQSFDAGWLFLKADAPGAEQPDFDDHGWRSRNVPHDWSIEGPFDPNNPTGGAGAFLPAGVGWYRKHFSLPRSFAERRVFIDFDGVMANSDVWINGTHLGRRPYGYVSFRYELTGHLKFGNAESNVLAVRADNSAQPASRWYAGAGIYRHVRLVITDPVHVDHWATFVSTPQVSAQHATIHVKTRIVNQSGAGHDVRVEFAIIAPNGRILQTVDTVRQTVAANRTSSFEQDIAVDSPELWELKNPVLYTLVARVLCEAQTVDDETTRFGIREFHFDAGTGFWMNGRNFKLLGVAIHGDAGGLGTAVPMRAWQRRLEILKSLGVNAIRTAHNPFAPEFLDLCDRMGFLIMDEMFDCWTVAKNPYDYHLYFKEWSRTDERDTVLRDRNHPSVVLYSAGNEIHDTPKAELAKEILRGLLDTFHQYDPTRPVTQALFRPNASHDYEDGLADMLDVIGQNYRENEILAAHAAKPTRKIVGTENGHDRKVWLALRDNPPYSGQFLWSGIDYLGESHHWPVISEGSGLLDRTGYPHPRGLQRESWWSSKPVVHIVRRTGTDAVTPIDPGYEAVPFQYRQTEFADWTPRNLSPHDEIVDVYSNCRDIELIVNGRSLGRQSLRWDASGREWRVKFEPGTIRAACRDTNASEELRTAGKPSRVGLSVDRARLSPEWNDVSYVSATVTDNSGIMVPSANDLVTFNLGGPGVIAAVDNGDIASIEPFQASQRHAYHGRCIAIVRATAPAGTIVVGASAPGLVGSQVEVLAVPASEHHPLLP
ncbi:MAG: DUF4982 domain-containing protein [Acidobacteriaceae bacterium]|nr:DUF4982 domain-containing protein [Acidobacteriaceae bacterium]